jgi:hypothetical protein
VKGWNGKLGNDYRKGEEEGGERREGRNEG